MNRQDKETIAVRDAVIIFGVLLALVAFVTFTTGRSIGATETTQLIFNICKAVTL